MSDQPGPYGQPPYGEPQYPEYQPPGYAQPAYPQLPYGEPAHPPQAAPPPYVPPQYAPPQYAPPQYGPPNYAAPPDYGQNPYGYGGPAYGYGPPQRSRRPLVIGLVGAALAVVAVVLVITLAGGSGGSGPVAAVRSFLNAAKNSDTAAMRRVTCPSYLSDDDLDDPDDEPNISSYSVGKARQPTDTTALVPVKLTSTDGDSVSIEFDVEKKGGTWLVCGAEPLDSGSGLPSDLPS